jgi:RNA-splicing ligase RtcB
LIALITIEGKYDKSIVMSDDLEESAKAQIINYLDQEAFVGSQVVIMPDVHAGAGCVIGFSSKLIERVVPNIVGVDIGCGVKVINLGKTGFNLEKLDNFIKNNIPHGFNVNSRIKEISPKLKEDLRKTSDRVGSSFNRDLLSIGSLGGGNHFIEVSLDRENNRYLLIHSGSRNFGYKVANYHQNVAKDYCSKKGGAIYKVPKSLSFLEGVLREDYLSDMQVALNMASANRDAISKEILRHLELDYTRLDSFTTIHNYIDVKGGFVRKGAVSAYKDERIIIPWNMRDGSIIALGLGSKEWNYSAPHGAGRILSRRAAKGSLSLKEFKSDMQGVFTTTATNKTIDESPRAYKDYQQILEKINQTVKVTKILKPIYNFKAN